jgi:hypothetical protein
VRVVAGGAAAGVLEIELANGTRVRRDSGTARDLVSGSVHDTVEWPRVWTLAINED